MKRILILLLTIGILCFGLSGCVDRGEETEAPTLESADVVASQGTEETAAGNLQTEPDVETFTIPHIEMPTQPDADYQLPPGEKPGGDVITE